MLEAKTVSSSRVTISQLMHPEHANLRGDVHGGWIMKLVDEAGALAAMRHAQCRVVTVAMDQITFHEPIRIGDLVILNAELTFVGRTSMEARVEVIAEDPVSGEQSRTNTAYAVYVALDDDRNPRPVPQLLAETDIQKRRMQEGKKRQDFRLRNRQEDQDSNGS